MSALRCALLLSICPALAFAQTTPGTLRFEGLDREYLLHTPTGWDGVTPLPLLVGLHGGGGSNQAFAGSNGFLEAANREGFIAVFPNAVAGVWNDGRGANQPQVRAINDVGFVAALIDEVANTLPIQADGVYATGTSNGGMLTHRLALELGYTPGGNRLAGFAPIVANLPLDLLPAEPSLPLHGLLAVGTIDPLMPFIGGQVSGSQGRVISSDNTRDVWRTRLGLAEAGFEEVFFDDISPDDGTVRAEFYETNYGPDFAYYVVDGGGHAVPGSISVVPDLSGFGPTNRDIVLADEIWSFFSTRPAIPDPFLAGDFNRDGMVNSADYTVWRDGAGGPPISNDYAIWRSHYGRAIAAMPIPEPSSEVFVPILLGFVASAHGRTSRGGGPQDDFP